MMDSTTTRKLGTIWRRHTIHSNTQPGTDYRLEINMATTHHESKTENKSNIQTPISNTEINKLHTQNKRHATRTHIKSIQTTQNKILRTAMGATRLTPTDELHNRAKTKKITTIITDRNADFYHKTSNHENPAIRRLGTYDIDNT
ncbi:hypothetical protein PR048_009610 [Dryococelus australis]|uniref:Uncharacterized protein n=1 Tax=Dryococelus australis TaxID=614101 RepID=A0ABQ9I0G2_9NEOP|nr:hypothetical protein PR048_009610 [Dryococelus australis]